jgi:hypothetical protein
MTDMAVMFPLNNGEKIPNGEKSLKYLMAVAFD